MIYKIGAIEMSNTDTYKGIYAMHKYWGKKPFNEISKFIEKYSEKGRNKGISEKVCPICGKVFIPKTSAANQRICCYDCMPDGV